MESQPDADDAAAAAVAAAKDLRQSLESTITSRRASQHELLASLHSLVPDFVSSLDLSLRLICAFNRRPFDPTPLPQSSTPRRRHHLTSHPDSLSQFHRSTRRKISPDQQNNSTGGNAGTSPADVDLLSAVRSMVAVCLLEMVPFAEIDSAALLRRMQAEQSSVTPAERAALSELGGDTGPIAAVDAALRRIAEDTGAIQLEEFADSGYPILMIWAIDRNKLLKELPEASQRPATPHTSTGTNQDQSGNEGGVVSRPHGDLWMRGMGMMGMPPRMMLQRPQLRPAGHRMGSPSPALPKRRTEEDELKDLEELLNKKTFREMQKSKTGEELLDLIHRPTARETAVAAKFKTKGGPQVKEYCPNLTKEDCRRQSGSLFACEKVHFKRIIAPHTDTNLGDCSFLDTCRHTKTCKYVHYQYDPEPDIHPTMMGADSLTPSRPIKPQRAEYCSEVELGEPQWINCDIRSFRMDILGQFGVIMADPPWDIHMELPYGTMADDEMRYLNVPALQTDGLIFLWVTGRAMELGRECLELWGYKRVEEIIWVKTNQLQRIIRTGRTGHWLNHSKEHCLVGIKGNPEVNRNIDTDVIVAEVRETSRKPDEMYAMLERISPRTRKLELFARMHNTHAGWLSLGNQLSGVRLVDEGLRARFKAAYPDVEVQPPSPPRATSLVDVDANRSPFIDSDSKQPLEQLTGEGIPT